MAAAACVPGGKDNGPPEPGNCRSDTDCDGQQICNPCSFRCVDDPGAVAEGEFSVVFDVATEGGSTSTEQNILGRVRWQGETDTLCFAALADLSDQLGLIATGTGPVEGSRTALQFRLPFGVNDVPLNQTIQLVDRYIQEERDTRTYGYWETSYFEPSVQATRNRGNDIHAVINTGTLEVTSFDLNGGDGIKAQARGVLRPAGPYDRTTNTVACFDDQANPLPSSQAFVDPRTTDDVCVAPFADHSILASLLCYYNPTPGEAGILDGAGLSTFRFDGSEGIQRGMTCFAGDSLGVIGVIAIGNRTKNGESSPWALGINIPPNLAVSNRVFTLGDQVEAFLFDIDFDNDGDIVFGDVARLEGRVGLEVIETGDRGYMLIWVEAGDGTDIPLTPAAPVALAETDVCDENMDQCGDGLTCQITPLPELPDDPGGPSPPPPFAQCVLPCGGGCPNGRTCFQYTLEGVTRDFCATDVFNSYERGCEDFANLKVCPANDICVTHDDQAEPNTCMPDCTNNIDLCGNNQTCYLLADGNPEAVCYNDLADFAECNSGQLEAGSFCTLGRSCSLASDTRAICFPECVNGQCAAGQTCGPQSGLCFRELARDALCGSDAPPGEGFACNFETDTCVRDNDVSQCRAQCDPDNPSCPPGLTCQPLVDNDGNPLDFGACLP